MPEYYHSPRWSAEILDCSMPMTFDSYSDCSYKCLYCFSQYQRGIGGARKNYGSVNVRPVDVAKVIGLFSNPRGSQFEDFILRRVPLQWGGLSDPFDEYERKYRVSLELLRFFRAIEYPICFSTKGTWWTQDPEYVEQFRGAKHFNVKVSIITLDEEKARVVEVGCDSPDARLKAIERIADFDGGGATLRLRPFIVGISSPLHQQLIRRAGSAGATAVSTEFFCLERRSVVLRKKLLVMSKLAGMDLLEYYRRNSFQSGYLRLNRDVKRPFMNEMEQAAKESGMRFYVSDAHFKERCANGCCCGLPPEWNYSRSQQTQAVLLAKQNGTVTWGEIESGLDFAKRIIWQDTIGMNTSSSELRAFYVGKSLYDYLRNCWNNPKSGKSPYRAFDGILKPVSVDASGNVVYQYDRSRE